MLGARSSDREGANDSPKAAGRDILRAAFGATLPESGDAAPTPRS
jgi:hypothetical protein